ncbi:MAG: fumarylacetoacetate hydrolase family protein [Erythrobacter sp.]|uniref:fumarylacetoacetate hydrolase family protein n=1 Tax=Erythrobacter sp. TaxID=1042 RepID=UPI0026222897|nr:fumarylacetoacetate hydrolase family protein [Erythrobacter sp.]MDJ0978130.1 fumarylacetoacetate hydrolase family protein [Erythrobacter sp.]
MSTQIAAILPQDVEQANLVGRVWVPGHGPVPVAVRDDDLINLSGEAITMSALLDLANPAEAIVASQGTVVSSLEEALAAGASQDRAKPHLLAPCDLQAIKAAGVTFAESLVERVIEERAQGDPAAAQAIRAELSDSIGADLSRIRPGSEEAAALKAALIERGLWSQYLEVGIGPDAEVFTKAQPMSVVGHGAQIGIHPKSVWNNPEPEVVLACNSRGQAVGATLGNDVNLRDFEGRSALLLGKAKDNNASCAIGPFIRLFDDAFGIDDVRAAQVALEVRGAEDGFVMHGRSDMSRISRDPLDLVGQACGANHQYPDGFMLFLGTLFAPTQDRDEPGQGFTHKIGDTVEISSPRLGTLTNEVTTSDEASPWTYGVGALVQDLLRRPKEDRA